LLDLDKGVGDFYEERGLMLFFLEEMLQLINMLLMTRMFFVNNLLAVTTSWPILLLRIPL